MHKLEEVILKGDCTIRVIFYGRRSDVCVVIMVALRGCKEDGTMGQLTYRTQCHLE